MGTVLIPSKTLNHQHSFIFKEIVSVPSVWTEDTENAYWYVDITLNNITLEDSDDVTINFINLNDTTRGNILSFGLYSDSEVNTSNNTFRLKSKGQYNISGVQAEVSVLKNNTDTVVVSGDDVPLVDASLIENNSTQGALATLNNQEEVNEYLEGTMVTNPADPEVRYLRQGNTWVEPFLYNHKHNFVQKETFTLPHTGWNDSVYSTNGYYYYDITLELSITSDDDYSLTFNLDSETQRNAILDADFYYDMPLISENVIRLKTTNLFATEGISATIVLIKDDTDAVLLDGGQGALVSAELLTNTSTQGGLNGLLSLQDVNEYLEANKAENYTFAGTIAVANWSGTEAPYIATISTTGVLDTDEPIVDLDLSSEDYANWEDIEKDWTLVKMVETGAGSIVFYASEVPSVDIKFIARVVR
jgi:hypothetical protein